MEEALRGMEEALRGMEEAQRVWGGGTEGYGGGTKGYTSHHLCYIGSLVCRSRLQHRPLTPSTHLSSPRTAKSLLGVDTSPLQWNEEQHWLWLCH